MAGFTFEHIHLRSPDPEATARFYEKMFDARIVRTMLDGKPRVELELGGMLIFIAEVAPDGKTAAPPISPYQGLDHFGLTVNGIDAVVAELKAKGAEITHQPRT
ncbi:MAG: VOC family protein, partial [Nevskiales bacterium]